jgi:hypothetical protein
MPTLGFRFFRPVENQTEAIDSSEQVPTYGEVLLEFRLDGVDEPEFRPRSA